MKVKELKNKIVIAELNPDADYIMLINPSLIQNSDFMKHLRSSSSRIYYISVSDVNKAIKFVEIPKKK